MGKKFLYIFFHRVIVLNRFIAILRSGGPLITKDILIKGFSPSKASMLFKELLKKRFHAIECSIHQISFCS